MLALHYPDLTIKTQAMTSEGDRTMSDTLMQSGGKGLFVKELEQALLDRSCDMAVHSMKDVPHTMTAGLCLAAILPRATANDVLLTREKISGDRLGVVGTASLRRQTQVSHWMGGAITVKPLRGNIHTRLQKLQNKEYDGIVLAQAGIDRAEIDCADWGLHATILPSDRYVPAPGQGSIGVQIREDDDDCRALARLLNHEPTQTITALERTLAGKLDGDCRAPIGVHAAFVQSESPLPAWIISTFIGDIGAGTDGGATSRLSINRAFLRKILIATKRRTFSR